MVWLSKVQGLRGCIQLYGTLHSRVGSRGPCHGLAFRMDYKSPGQTLEGLVLGFGTVVEIWLYNSSLLMSITLSPTFRRE